MTFFPQCRVTSFERQEPISHEIGRVAGSARDENDVRPAYTAIDKNPTKSPPAVSNDIERPIATDPVTNGGSTATAFEKTREPGKLPIFRVPNRQDLEKEAVIKMEENSKGLPPPIDEVHNFQQPPENAGQFPAIFNYVI